MCWMHIPSATASVAMAAKIGYGIGPRNGLHFWDPFDACLYTGASFRPDPEGRTMR
jgi:hypothetical protein